MLKRTLRSTLLALILSLSITHIATADMLKLDVYNPGAHAIFPVSSVLITGHKEAILIDSQFERIHAEQLVQKIRDSGKKLTTIYISHGDPDFYFGLAVLHAAYPDAKIVAPAPVVAHIRATMQHKLAFWEKQLNNNAPNQLIVPEPLQGNTLTLEGHHLTVIGLESSSPDRSFVWIPSLRAVVGGVVVEGNKHLWLADTPTPAARQQWINTLDKIIALQPHVVIPGHFAAQAPHTIQSVFFTKKYLEIYEAEARKAKDAHALVHAVKQHYPNLLGESALELGAKVSKGEMNW
ncbi:MAG: MBL fold metallo-hydrolase [Ottowia sp.]|nr:MBL fold metallo-hydrolase [Ottowia sp.]